MSDNKYRVGKVLTSTKFAQRCRGSREETGTGWRGNWQIGVWQEESESYMYHIELTNVSGRLTILQKNIQRKRINQISTAVHCRLGENWQMWVWQEESALLPAPQSAPDPLTWHTYVEFMKYSQVFVQWDWLRLENYWYPIISETMLIIVTILLKLHWTLWPDTQIHSWNICKRLYSETCSDWKTIAILLFPKPC